MKLNVQIDSDEALELEEVRSILKLNGKQNELKIHQLNKNRFVAHSDLKQYTILVIEENPESTLININGHQVSISSKDDVALLLDKLGMDVSARNTVTEIIAPMPGLIIDINVDEGEVIEEGAGIIVLEAMKMENMIKSPVAATISKIHVKNGQNVEKNQVLISFSS